MSSTTTYRTLLAHAVLALADDEPDGPVVRQVLLLAAQAGLHRADGTGGADWDLHRRRHPGRGGRAG
jgi:hypothetical protein